MGKLGARLKVVRPRHPQSCEQKRFEFRQQMARQRYLQLKAHAEKLKLPSLEDLGSR